MSIPLKRIAARLNPSRWLSAARSTLRAYDVDEVTAARFRARQLQAVLRLTPLMMVANLLNVLLVATTLWDERTRLFLSLWIAGIAAMALQSLRVWARARSAPPRERASRRSMRRATANAALLAAMWAAMPLALFADANDSQQLMVATITCGMLGAGGFALASTPAAGTVYVLIIGAASAVALVRSGYELAWPVSALLVIYGAIVIAGIWATAKLFGARLMAEANAAHQNEVIGLLLRDFEEHASDVLWEIDERGRFRHASPRLARLFGVAPHQINTTPVSHLLRRAVLRDEQGMAHLAVLHAQMRRGVAFRDLPLVVSTGSELRWWSLTAKPLLDATGQPTGWRGVAADVTETHRANRRLSWLAHFDPLTGLANRHHFRNELSRRLADAEETPVACAVLYLDLDNFKTINDTMGHAVGDALLQEVAQRLLACARRNDTVARLGGDEFAIILHNIPSASDVERLTRQILEALLSPCTLQGARVVVGSSIGVAIAPRDGRDIDTLLNHADLALYAAKSAGRGEFRFFEPQMAAQTRRRLAIELALRDALAQQALSLVFQPQVDLVHWKVTGFEALLRWRHPELGDVPPAEFIPVAEEAGLIQTIGDWVLREACRHAANWPDALTLSVNVSPVQALSQDLARAALAAAHAADLAPHRLELEITESVFLNETPATMKALRALHDAGLRIALDDFGTGYSSLAYLRRFPFHTLKIDRSFVRELLTRRDARAIVRMVVHLARSLHMKTVAEGVEEPAHAGVLLRYGCDAMQGYLAARPMAPERIAGFLRDWSHQRPPVSADAPASDSMQLAETA